MARRFRRQLRRKGRFPRRRRGSTGRRKLRQQIGWRL